MTNRASNPKCDICADECCGYWQRRLNGHLCDALRGIIAVAEAEPECVTEAMWRAIEAAKDEAFGVPESESEGT
jgi:hypothetical protein